MYRDKVVTIRVTEKVKRALDLYCQYMHTTKADFLENSLIACMNGELVEECLLTKKINKISKQIEKINELRNLLGVEEIKAGVYVGSYYGRYKKE